MKLIVCILYSLVCLYSVDGAANVPSHRQVGVGVCDSRRGLSMNKDTTTTYHIIPSRSCEHDNDMLVLASHVRCLPTCSTCLWYETVSKGARSRYSRPLLLLTTSLYIVLLWRTARARSSQGYIVSPCAMCDSMSSFQQ